MSVILVGLHCTVGIAMTGIYHLLYVIHVGCKLTGGAVIGVHDTIRVCLSFW